MKLAWIGDAEAVWPLLDYLANSPDHQLAGYALSQSLAAKLPTAARPGERDWREFFAESEVDAVIVAGHSDEALDAARQMAAAGRALVLLPNLPPETTLVYELAFLQSEQPLPVVPLYWYRGVPRLQTVRRWLGQGAAGPLGQLRHIRAQHNFAPVPETSMRYQVESVLLDDLDLLRFLGGDYNQISATGDATLPTLTLELKGEALPPAQWLAGAAAHDELRLELTGELAVLRLVRDANSVWNLDPDCSAAKCPDWPQLNEASGQTGGAAAAWYISQLRQSLEGKFSRPGLEDLSRAFELREAIAESLQRRRTIDVHHEAPSERNTFKSRMTALGCMVLLSTLGAVSLFLMISAAFKLPPLVASVGRVLVFAPLFLFLILQGLVFVAKPPRKP